MLPEVIPILGMFTGIIVTGMVGWVVVRGMKMWADARQVPPGSDPDLLAAVSALRDQVDQLQHQVAETQERLDFTERLLAQGRAPDRLPGGS